MLLSYKWMDGIGLGSLCGAIIRASLRDANNDLQSVKGTLAGGNDAYKGVPAQEQMNIFYPPQVIVFTPGDNFFFLKAVTLKYFAASEHNLRFRRRGRAGRGNIAD